MAQCRVSRRKLEWIVWAHEHGKALLERGFEPMDIEDNLSPRQCIQYTAAVGTMIVDEVAGITDQVHYSFC